MAPSDLPISLDRATTLAHNFLRIKQRIANTPRPPSSTPRSSSPTPAPANNTSPTHDQHHRTSTSSSSSTPLLVAVSKLKPANDILFLHGQPPFSPQTSITIPKNKNDDPKNPSSTTSPSASPEPTLPQSPFHDHFGENYTDELISKSRILPRTIKWHFIGQLQSNKCKSLAEEVENLWCVESVDSQKKADLLEKGRRACVERLRKEEKGKGEGEGEDQVQIRDGESRGGGRSIKTDGDGRDPSENADKDPEQELNTDNADPPTARLSTLSLSPSAPPSPPNPLTTPLHIHLQINTSLEPQKSGLLPSPPTHPSITSLYHHITTHCPHLLVTGLMTIGAIARSQSLPEGNENEDFEKLKEVRDEVCAELELDRGELGLSMGMSEDFESAVRCGSGEVRVGSGIFGERVRDRREARVVVEEEEEEEEQGG